MRDACNNKWRFKCLLNGLLLAILSRVSAETTDICIIGETMFEISFVVSTWRNWEQAQMYCHNEGKGHLVQLKDPDLRKCVEDTLRYNISLVSDNSSGKWWTGGRFDCPCVGYIGSQLNVEYGQCELRKSFICEYPGECSPDTERCIAVDDKCLCVHLLASGIEATWLRAYEYCRLRPGGKLAEMTSQHSNKIAPLLLQSGRYWLAPSQDIKYSYYDTHGRGYICESVGFDDQGRFRSYEQENCHTIKPAICIKYLGTITTKKETSTIEKLETMDRKEKLSTGILAILVVISILLFVGAVVFFTILFIRHNRAVKGRKGCAPYDGITFFKSDDVPTRTHQETPTTTDIYSEIPTTHIPTLPKRERFEFKSDATDSIAKCPPDVVLRSDAFKRNTDSSSDLTLPSNIPTQDIANVLVQRELNKGFKNKAKSKPKLSNFSALRRNKYSDKSKNMDSNFKKNLKHIDVSISQGKSGPSNTYQNLGYSADTMGYI